MHTKIPGRSIPLLVATNILSASAWVLYYLSYQAFGVIYTILLFSATPLLVYFAAALFLKEPLRRRHAIAFVIVLAAIVTAQLIR